MKKEYMHLFLELMKTEIYLKKMKLIKEISEDIIDFLAIIEDFQKKLWEKKPLILESNYVFSLKTLKEKLNKEKFEKILEISTKQTKT
jgi:adenine-specific DNA-methyltransferase